LLFFEVPALVIATISLILMRCLESFALIESEIGLSHGTASRSMTVQNADDRVSIKIYRSVSGIASKEVYKAQLWAFGSSKSPVAVGDEAVKVGESGVGFM